MSTRWDVLVIDDERVVREVLVRVFEAAGLRVACAGSGEEALAHDALADCRLAVCDLMLPGMSGLEVMRAIRARRPELSVLAITGYATREIATQVAEAGATAFLAKPFDHDELFEKVRQVLEGTGRSAKEERS